MLTCLAGGNIGGDDCQASSSSATNQSSHRKGNKEKEPATFDPLLEDQFYPVLQIICYV